MTMSKSEIVDFMKELVEEMSEDNIFWQIESVCEFQEKTNENGTYAKLDDGSTYKKQDDIYIKQWTGILGYKRVRWLSG